MFEYGIESQHELADEYLEILSQRAPPLLSSLILRGWHVSFQGLAALIPSFPVSIKHLDMECVTAVTPQLFRSILKLPLTKLCMDMRGVPTEHLQELQEIAQMERPLGLNMDHCYFSDEIYFEYN